MLFVLLLIVVPLLEMWLLIEVGSHYGAVAAIAAVVATALLGVLLLRTQGLATLLRASRRLQQGELPAQELVEGLLLAIGGALLLTPGFATDLLGFSCLLPLTRRAWARHLLPRLLRRFSPPRGGASAESGEVIDGEYQREPDSVSALSEKAGSD